MMHSYDYVAARMADQRDMAHRYRAATPLRARRSTTQRLGNILRPRPDRSEDMGGGR